MVLDSVELVILDDDCISFFALLSFGSDVSQLLDRDNGNVVFGVYFLFTGKQACVNILASDQLLAILGGR